MQLAIQSPKTGIMELTKIFTNPGCQGYQFYAEKISLKKVPGREVLFQPTLNQIFLVSNLS